MRVALKPFALDGLINEIVEDLAVRRQPVSDA